MPSEQIKSKINSIVLDLMKLQKPLLLVVSKIAKSDVSKKGHYDLVEEKTRIKQEIAKLEFSLNAFVYELYSLRKENIMTIEESLK